MNNDLERLKDILPLGDEFIKLNFTTGDATGQATDGSEPLTSPSGRGKGQKGIYTESEADLQQKAIDYLHLKGYRVAHFRPAQSIKNGKVTWRTAVAADGAGFPDLCAVGKDIRFVECKSERGVLSPNQQAWIAALKRARVKAFILYPHNWDEFTKWVG
jgi:hypothetical protein